jgi:cytoskeletal protein CcmA (bactofilin family)
VLDYPHMNKRLSYLAAVLLGLAFTATPALAAEFKSGQAVSVSQSDTVSGDLYAAANDVSVDSKLPGDAFLAGSAVRVNGDIGQSLFVAGSMVNIGANVADDLRVAGSQVMLGGTVQGDVQATGGMVYILPSAVINGDLYIAAGSVTVEGKVLGSVRVASGELILKGEVGKEVYAQADKVTVGPQAKVGGKLFYESMKEASIDQGSSIAGGVEYKKVDRPERGTERGEKHGFAWGWAIFWLLVCFAFYLVTALVGNYFFKQRVAEITANTLDDFAKQTGWGFIWLIILPVACIILLCTIVGIPLGLFGLLFYCLVSGLSKILAGIILGAWLMKLITKKKGWNVDWKAIALGQFVMMLVLLVPFVGWLFALVFMLAALGGLMNALKPIVK